MAWRTIGSNRYYQQTYRDIDGRVRSRYYGRGQLATTITKLDARERVRRIEARELAQAERERLLALERAIVEYFNGIDELFPAWMRLSGWHLHRGRWQEREDYEENHHVKRFR